MKLATLIGILVVKAIAIAWVIVNSGIGLGPDEAQYWTWSQNLDFGYYSKPPGIAWQIWLGTKVLGDTLMGVRLLSIIFSFLLAIAVYFLALACRLKEETAFWSGVLFALAPMGLLSSFLAVTDLGMVFFWVIACIMICRGPHYPLAGLAIACGALFKWPIYLLWVYCAVFALVNPSFRRRSMGVGILISLLGLVPSIYWNVLHDWVTFKHVAYTVNTPIKSSGNFWEFIGAQAVLLSPILFALFIMAIFSLRKYRKEITPQLAFCITISVVTLSVYSIVSIFKKMQGNWCIFAYPSGVVFLAWYLCEKVSWGKKWATAGVATSIALVSLVFAIPKVQSNGLLSRYQIPYRINPFRHNVGWENLQATLDEVGYDSQDHFLFGDKYQMSSILSYYNTGRKRAYFLNLHGIRKNQFSFWPSMADKQLGKTGYFVLAENSPHLERQQEQLIEYYSSILKEYFDEVDFLGVKPIFYVYGKPVKGAIIFKCLGYNGQLPSDPELY